MKKYFDNNKGFTLIELVISSSLLLVVVLTLWGVYGSAINNIRAAKELRVVSDHLQAVVEKIHLIGFSNITKTFPHDNAINLALVGGADVDNETIKVKYPLGVDQDPLAIEVEISWTDFRGDNRSETIKTYNTGRL